MYVLEIARGYPTSKYKQNGIFEFDQAKALVAEGCKVVYASIDIRSIRRWRQWGMEKKIIDGVHIYGINIPIGNAPKSIQDKVSLWALRKLYKIILKEQGQPDILHGHFTKMGYYASWLKEESGVPLVVTEHSSLMNKKDISERQRMMGSKAFKEADQLISVSDSLSEVIEYNFGVKSKYIPNIVDTELFSYKGEKNHKRFRIISTGNLVYTKRMDLAIEAFNRAFKDNHNVELIIFGDGPERKKLEELVHKYDLKDNITLCGQRSREEIADALKDGDLFVLPSQTETFGVAYIEALASGTPVIATRCGGPEMFVDEHNGIMVDVDDIDALVEAMVYMYNNIENYDNERISEDIKRKFSPKAIAQELILTYNEVLK
ncbi:glycosyltransferase [Wansuia hejianensis]|uniref:Glycosyltransferase n=1 Tax=Wansuia hejianensis TaxID=2763667 RepID=A0A926IM88_9FIRM|nr:glycosyltransferase [Wansuia hejianensis]MBC8590175.1 glycosyltransferase [Wansuia hejianensis]